MQLLLGLILMASPPGPAPLWNVDTLIERLKIENSSTQTASYRIGYGTPRPWRCPNRPSPELLVDRLSGCLGTQW
ncbi:hypothetical protein K438DRAFT_999407 [Mycena galopus ATCC 62051]|nr:hypothetical protein K438DRAFT_999407 [Mycena galopus ATCC 62051]